MTEVRYPAIHLSFDDSVKEIWGQIMPSLERAAAGAHYSRNSLWDRVLKCQFAEMSDYGTSGQKMGSDQSLRDLIAQRSLSLFAAKLRAALGDEGSYSFPRIIGAAGRDDGLLFSLELIRQASFE